MTTMVIVKANHGWPVRVTSLDMGPSGMVPGDEKIVEANSEGIFNVWNGRDLLIHEIQPQESTS